MGRVAAGVFMLVLVGCLVGGDESAAPAVHTVFGLQRPKNEDVVCFRSNDVLRGKVLNETISINTPYGLLAVPLRRCAGMSFEGEQANTETIVTVNFNRYTGIIMDRVIRFRVGESGEEMQIRKERVRQIHLQQTEGESAFAAPGVSTCLFVMANGDLLTGKPDLERLTLVAGYVEVPVFLAEIDRVNLQGGERPMAFITKKTKEVLGGKLATEELTIQLDIGTPAEAIFREKFARIFVDTGNAQAAALFGEVVPDKEEASDGTAVAGGVSAAGAELKLTIPGPEKVTMRMRQIPAGTFLMGSPPGERGRDNDERLHEVTFSKPFYLGVYEVTQAQWAAVMGTHPSFFNGRQSHPVEQVSWEDCQKFIERLNTMGIGSFRLPTEAEWEYAARAGTKSAFHWGDYGDTAGEYAWFEGNSQGQTHEVGTRKPNAWGLHDMAGNVYEWCQDWMGNYRADRQTDPRGPFSGSFRVYRGGSWYTSAVFCRSALRYGSSPSSRRANLGFRLAREVE